MPNNIHDIEIRSEEVQEILSKVPHWMIRWGNVVFLSLMLMLLFISWFIKYPDILQTEAVITTEIPPQKEFAKSTGKLKALLVENNQTVKEGQVLGIIENSANYEDVFRLKKMIDSIQINHQSFSFPIEDLPILFLGEIETQYAFFANNYHQYSIYNQLKPFSNEELATEFSISESYQRMKNLESQKKLNEAELVYQKKELARNEVLFAEGVISETEYEKKKLDYLQAERSFENLGISISQIREAISNGKNSLRSLKINRTTEESTLLKNVIQSLSLLKKGIRDWELSYVLTSNIAGKVYFLDQLSINQTLNSGDLIFTIVPSKNSSFLARLKTPSQNSGKIQLGQQVNIKLAIYPDTEFGVLEGIITTIPLIPDKEGFYQIEASLAENLITSYGREISFKQEMRGVGEIVTEDLRLIERFFYQFKEVFNR